MTTTPTASDRGQGTAATAADQGKHLGGVAAEEAQNVAGDVAEQLRSLLDDTAQQVSEQSSVQRDRLVELLKGLSHDLHQMADASNGSGLAGQLVRGGAERAQAVSSRLDGREPSELVDEVRSFARRKPGVFLAGALVVGVVAGRFARGAKDAQDSPSPSPAHPVASADPAVQPVPRPVTGPLDPAYGATVDSTPSYGDDPVTTR